MTSSWTWRFVSCTLISERERERDRERGTGSRVVGSCTLSRAVPIASLLDDGSEIKFHKVRQIYIYTHQLQLPYSTRNIMLHYYARIRSNVPEMIMERIQLILTISSVQRKKRKKACKSSSYTFTLHYKRFHLCKAQR